MAVFESSVRVACPQQKVFDFFRKLDNHVKLSPPEAGLTFINPPEEISVGSKIEFKVLVMGYPQQITHEITEFDPPHGYTEKLINGVLPKFIHQHKFEAVGENETLVIDRIEFQPPGGMLGFMVTESKIMENLEDGYHHRQEKLKQMLEA